VRVSRGCAGGLVVWLLLVAAWCRLRGVEVIEMLKVGDGETAIRPVALTLLPILLLLGIAISLGRRLPRLRHRQGGPGRALPGSLKSIRTGLLIGTLTTLVMLPLALVLLGILAGYVGGWVDDVIQYLYTTLNSIPGVLLIAASVLVVQVHHRGPSRIVRHRRLAQPTSRLLALCADPGGDGLDGSRPPAARPRH
jgi:peptide/nickel transport system permease protein